MLDLWIEGKIDINGLDVPKEICRDYNFKNISPELVENFSSVETFRVRETGELKARIILQDDYKLYPLDKGDKK